MAPGKTDNTMIRRRIQEAFSVLCAIAMIASGVILIGRTIRSLTFPF